jgi:hypothetical protein
VSFIIFIYYCCSCHSLNDVLWILAQCVVRIWSQLLRIVAWCSHRRPSFWSTVATSSSIIRPLQLHHAISLCRTHQPIYPLTYSNTNHIMYCRYSGVKAVAADDSSGTSGSPRSNMGNSTSTNTGTGSGPGANANLALSELTCRSEHQQQQQQRYVITDIFRKFIKLSNLQSIYC